MYSIHDQGVTEDFYRCWVAVGKHIASQVEKGQLNFYRTTLAPPIREHHVFRLGNQLFTVYIVDIESALDTPASLKGVISGSQTMNAIPCTMEMKKGLSGQWEVNNSGWGLTHAITGEEVNPPDLVTDEFIEMSDWELQDFAIQQITKLLNDNGCSIASHCSDPDVSPSIWFTDSNNVFSYAIVKPVRYPQIESTLPENINDIYEYCKPKSINGYFYSVAAANAMEAFDPDATEGMKLYRGHGLLAKVSEPVRVVDTKKH